MTQNRNKLIELLISNLSNFIIHTILEKSINTPELTSKYRKESLNSFNIASIYRNKINPLDKPLNLPDVKYLKEKLKSRVNSELLLRISKGYQGINLSLVDVEINLALKNLGLE